MSLGYLWALLVKDPLIILSTIVFGSVSVAVSFFDPQGRATDKIARAWARLLLFLAGVRLRVAGLEHLDSGGPFVFAGNHLSLYDTPVVLCGVPKRFLFLVNAKYVRLPFLGTHLRRTGHFAVNPDDVRGSLRIMTEAARTINRRGLSVLVFPEGSRSRTGRLGEFKEGAAYIAIKAGVPLVPFAIRGTREVLDIGSLYVKGGRVDLVFGPPISVKGYTLKDRAALTARLREAVAQLAGALENAA